MKSTIRILVVLATLLALEGPIASAPSPEPADDLDDVSMDDDTIDNHQRHDILSEMSDDEFLAGGLGAGELPASAAAQDKANLMLRIMSTTLKRPGMKERFGQILPIIRVMSSPQRLALASLVMQQVMVPEQVQEQRSPIETAVRLGATVDGSSNLTSQLLLPLSADIAQMFRGAGLEALGVDTGEAAEARSYRPPQALQMGPRWRRPGATGVPRAPNPLPGRRAKPSGANDQFLPPGVNRRNAHITPSIDMKPPPLPTRPHPPPMRAQPPTSAAPDPVPTKSPSPSEVNSRRNHHACSLFSDTICASVDHYPEDAILASIRADKHTADVLLADSTHTAAAQRRQDDDFPSEEESESSASEEESGEDSLLCSSLVKYARPQRARATSGQWKYIVNTEDHTQTLRLEKCLKPEEPCSFVSEKFRSHCTQVYNYHRLLTWDKELGLHMDIFKVPTCCSCQVQGGVHNAALNNLLNSGSRRPSLQSGLGSQGGSSYQQPKGEYSNLQETIVSGSARPVHHYNKVYQQPEATTREPSSWPFRKAATRRPPLKGPYGLQSLEDAASRRPLLHRRPYGAQSLEEASAPDVLPHHPPLPLQSEFEYPPLGNVRRTATSYRNRTRSPPSHDLLDLQAEGTQRRPVPIIISSESIRHPNPTLASRLPPRLPVVQKPVVTTTSTTTSSTTSTASPPVQRSTTPAASTAGGPPTPAPKRVNYNYHPIIDFFGPREKHVSVQEPRQVVPLRSDQEQKASDGWSPQQSDWSPITDEPRFNGGRAVEKAA